MHDNAPAHRPVTTWLKDQGVDVMNWPPYSPDLNPIENLWGHLKMTVDADVFTDPEDLEASVIDFWDNLDDDYVDSLVLSFKSRLEKLIEMDGESTFLGSKHPLNKSHKPEKP